MEKRLTKHQEKGHFVKIYLTDSDGLTMVHFEGIILDHNKDFVQLLDLQDFNYDGYVVFRKKDINEIKRTGNEVFFQKILQKENLIAPKIKSCNAIRLSTMEKMFKQLQKQNRAIIIECKYHDKEIFQIGPIHSVEKNKVRVRYFNAKGEYDIKPVSSKFNDITYFRVDDPYSNLFYKYAKPID